MTFFLLITFFSCEKGTLIDSRCANCFIEEPTEADIEITLTPNSYTNSVTTISIYEGYVQDSILMQKFETVSTTWTHKMTLNKMYTFVARYYFYNTYYEVINSVTPGIRYEKFICTDPCYKVIGNKCDLRLKYQ